MMEERNMFRLLIGIVVSVVVIGVLFVVGTANDSDEANWWAFAVAAIVAAIALAAALVAVRRRREMRLGIPSEDERSTAIKMRAGYLSFFISMYLCLGLGWVFGVFMDGQTIEFPAVGELMFILVAVMGTIYLVTWAAVSRGKGMP